MKKLVTAASVALILAAIAAPLAARSQPVSSGDAAFAAGDFNGAASAYAAALVKNPNDPDANLGIGTVELYCNQLDAARTHLQRALQLAPSSPAAHARLDALDRRAGTPQDYRITFAAAEARIPLIGVDPLPMLAATIDGVPVKLLIDTGAGGIDLSDAVVKKLHLATTAGGTGVFAGGRAAEVRRLRIDRLELPGVTVRGIPGEVVPGAALGDIDGIVGTAFLYHFLATIDYAHASLVLRPAGDSATYLAAAKRSGAATIPMWLAGDRFMVARARVNAAPEALFSIDTGGAGVGVDLTKTELAAAGITPDASHAQSFEGGGGATQALPFTATSVSMGGVTVRDVPGVYFPSGGTDIFPFKLGGRVSHEFFRHMAVTFDFSAMLLVLARS
jgi:predicted aspartyl protease